MSDQDSVLSRLEGDLSGSESTALATISPRMGGGSAPPPPKGIAYGQLAWSHKFLLLGFIITGTLIGTGIVVFKKPVYPAITTVELVGFNQAFMGMANLDPQANTDAQRESPSNAQTQIRILTSRTLISRVVSRLNSELAPESAIPSTFFTKLRDRIPYLRQEPAVQTREALGLASSTLSARALPPTRLIEITCQSTSPRIAAAFVNAVAAEHLAQVLASRAAITQRTSEFVESQLEEAKSRLAQSSDKLREFVQQSGVDFFPQHTTLADSTMRSLQAEVSSVQGDRIAKQVKWESARMASLEELPDVVNDPSLQSLRIQLITLRRDMAQLLTTLTPENLKVKRVQSQITEIEAAFEKEKKSILHRLQSDFEEAQRKEKMLAQAYRNQTHSVSAQTGKAAEYASLLRDVDTQQAQYQHLLQESNQAALIALAPSGGIRVVDPAYPIRVPLSPDPSKDIPMWGIGLGVLGYGLLFLREILRRKKLTKLFDAPGYTQTVLGVPELGVIPSTQMVQPRRKAMFGSQREGSSPLDLKGEGRSNSYGQSSRNSTEAWEKQRSSVLSESFRQTLVSLLRTKPDEHSPVYVITSAGPGEGKTTLSANLARAMAETGQRVLLVDADLRRPSLHSLYGSSDHKGLSDILAGSTEVPDLALDDFIQDTEVENLSVMNHGLTQVETPALLFFSPKVGALVEVLQKRYDCVLFDTAPALAFPDARLWGKHSDGVVMVVRAGVTSRDGALAACERFLNDGISVLGTILNDWTPDSDSNSGYYLSAYHAAGSKR